MNGCMAFLFGLLFCIVSISDYVMSKVRRLVNDEMERIWQEAVVV
jgi:hypothetical protein